jgi:transcriptional regulator with XRE-family HTH domain
MATLTIDVQCFETLRQNQGLDTVQSLATALGVDKGTASRVLNGKAAPGPRFISSVLRTFPVKFEDVFVIVDDEAPALPAAVRSAA